MSTNVFVLDRKKQPRNPVHPSVARQLLRDGKAAIYKRFPFTIILQALRIPDVVVRAQCLAPLRLKIDPGAKFTGIALVNDASGEVVFAAEFLTKFNRSQQKLEKTHWIDAACVGKSTPILKIKGVKPLLIKAMGHGSRQSCRTDKYGFPNRHCSRIKFHFGFQTGDIVKAVVTTGKKVGEYVGKLATRKVGSFDIFAKLGRITGISHRFCKSIHKKDGYAYST